MTSKKKAILSAVFTWAVAIWVFITTSSLHSGSDSLIRPEYIPRVVASVLIVLGIGIFIQGMREKVSDKEKAEIAEKKEERKSEPLIKTLTPLLTFILIFLFLFFLKHIGITLSALWFLTVQMTLLSGDFSWKSWVRYFVIALISSVMILFIFRYGFKLKIPVNGLGF